MPPLPLPAVPLRRSEPKAEPAAPLMIAKLEYGTTQDWNTDPGDVDNLMRHCPLRAVGLWYGWKTMNVNELVALHKAGQTSQAPLPLRQRPRGLRVHQGPARRPSRSTCSTAAPCSATPAAAGPSSPARSARKSRRCSPTAPFDRLEMDHPIFRAFHKYTYGPLPRSSKAACKLETEGPPRAAGHEPRLPDRASSSPRGT